MLRVTFITKYKSQWLCSFARVFCPVTTGLLGFLFFSFPAILHYIDFATLWMQDDVPPQSPLKIKTNQTFQQNNRLFPSLKSLNAKGKGIEVNKKILCGLHRVRGQHFCCVFPASVDVSVAVLPLLSVWSLEKKIAIDVLAWFDDNSPLLKGKNHLNNKCSVGANGHPHRLSIRQRYWHLIIPKWTMFCNLWK